MMTSPRWSDRCWQENVVFSIGHFHAVSYSPPPFSLVRYSLNKQAPVGGSFSLLNKLPNGMYPMCSEAFSIFLPALSSTFYLSAACCNLSSWLITTFLQWEMCQNVKNVKQLKTLSRMVLGSAFSSLKIDLAAQAMFSLQLDFSFRQIIQVHYVIGFIAIKRRGILWHTFYL